MKFVALALTILLAVGSQAKSLYSDVQSDGPSQLEHVRAAAMVYLAQVKEAAQKTLDHLEGTDYAEYKIKLSESLDKLQEYAQTPSTLLVVYGDTFSRQFLEATKQVREKVMADVEDLRTKLEPKREELQVVLQKHVDEYRSKLEPVFQQYATKHKQEMDALRAQLQPLVDEMRTKVEANVEETKAVLVPMIEVVRTRLTERLEELRSMVAPYVDEYKEQMVKAVGEVREKVAPHTQELQGKLDPYMAELKAKFVAFYEAISQSLEA